MSLNSGWGSSLWFSSNSRVNARTLSLNRPREPPLNPPGPRHRSGVSEGSGRLPVGGFSVQRPVTEAAIAVAQVKAVVMVMTTAPAQSVAPGSQVHLHDLMGY